MLITRVERQKRRRLRFNVYVDGKFAFGLSESTLLKLGLHVGDRLSQKDLEQIKIAEDTEEAKKVALNYLSYRPRSFREVTDHLCKKGYPLALAQQTAKLYTDLGMINDLKFAQMFVRDRLRRKPLGQALLRQQLLAKGILSTISDKVLEEFISQEDQERAAAELVSRRLRLAGGSFARLDAQKKKKRLLDFLLRRGFSQEIAYKTVRTILSR